MTIEKGNIIAEAFSRHRSALEASIKSILLDVERAAEILLATVKNGRKLLICGNGGSAAVAQHLAGEWLGKYKNDRRPIPAIALTTDTSVITAVGNDYGFHKIFSRQIDALGETDDVLVAITTSGQSPNILEAIESARAEKMKVIALTGASGAALKNLADIAITVPSEETARLQEIHELVIHVCCEYLDRILISP